MYTSVPNLGETGESYVFPERGIIIGLYDYARDKLNGREKSLRYEKFSGSMAPDIWHLRCQIAVLSLLYLRLYSRACYTVLKETYQIHIICFVCNKYI